MLEPINGGYVTLSEFHILRTRKNPPTKSCH